MGIIGVVLKKGFIEDNRPILFIYEDVRRLIQRNGFDVEIIIPGNDYDYINYQLDCCSGIIIQDNDNSNLINILENKNIPYCNDINNIESFINNLSDKDYTTNSYKCIGVTCRYFELDKPILYISNKLLDCFINIGCIIRLIIPVQDVCYPITRGSEFLEFTDKEILDINKQLSMVSGFVFPGGYKFTPFDRYVLDYAYENDIPCLGICLGMQLISCFKKNIEIVPIETGINHKQDDDNLLTHYVNIEKNSILYKILDKDKIKVNSFHRMMATPNEKLNIVAYSLDGVIEGVEIPNKKFILGIQWHPEISYNIDENSKKIIDYFVEVL